MAADSALGGVLEKNGDKLPEKTQQILKEVQEKFLTKPGAEHAGQGGNGSNGVGNGGSPGNSGSTGSGGSNGNSGSSGKDTVTGGNDTMVGGHDTMVGGQSSDVSVTKLGAVKLPDLSGVKAVGAVTPVDMGSIASSTSAAKAAISKAAPAAQVDLTLIGQSVDALTKKLGKLAGG